MTGEKYERRWHDKVRRGYLAIVAAHSFATPVRSLWGDEASTQKLAQSMQATDIHRLP